MQLAVFRWCQCIVSVTEQQLLYHADNKHLRVDSVLFAIALANPSTPFARGHSDRN
ncbi:hypothetical protein [uncultured Nostoc sp.]|uniref:hypothetical protein n=1 Tax=uncultured Nostoc sp. TaxID=340711 RepID=UPI0035C95F97